MMNRSWLLAWIPKVATLANIYRCGAQKPLKFAAQPRLGLLLSTKNDRYCRHDITRNIRNMPV